MPETSKPTPDGKSDIPPAAGKPAGALQTIYTIGIIGFTAVYYPENGFWVAAGKALLWPLVLALAAIDRIWGLR